ncbi:MAG: prephenate dehydratase [Acidobacteriales bacterium]|nr:prephenate dehydratase [Terriglobales bacterium]
MKVAIQGEKGSFSHEAVLRMVPGAAIVTCSRSAEVFDRLETRSVAAAVIPIENSLAGPVTEHYDLLLTRAVFIQREFRMRISHNLIAAPGVRRKDVVRAYSHPVALDQCRDFFQRNPGIEPVPFYDTAGAVKHVLAANLRDSAAIAGRQAARAYQGKILAAGIEDDKRNFTRFFLVRRKRHVLKGAAKTSTAFGLKNVPGALYQALGIFASHDLNLTKIESRPMRGRPWEYVFYADFLSGDTAAARAALGELAAAAEMVKVLGIYPVGI